MDREEKIALVAAFSRSLRRSITREIRVVRDSVFVADELADALDALLTVNVEKQ